MKVKELNEKVQLLKAGQPVEINGDWFRAFRLERGCGFTPCAVCTLDSVCDSEVALVCSDLDGVGSSVWYLNFAYK